MYQKFRIDISNEKFKEDFNYLIESCLKSFMGKVNEKRHKYA